MRPLIFRRWYKTLEDRMQAEMLTKAEVEKLGLTAENTPRHDERQTLIEGAITWEPKPDENRRRRGAH